MQKRIFSCTLFLSGILTTVSMPSFASVKFTLEEATIDSIQHAIQTSNITCVQLIENYLTRIKQYNLSLTRGAPINAFTEINPSVLDEARRLDEYYTKTHRLSGTLHCVPVLLKDNIDSYDTTTSAGSFALLGNQPIKDADLTSRLRQAGAIILGKGGMDEFAWGMKGLSSRSGRIGNAYDPTQNPGGSSGGPGAGVSANFAVIGIGSDNSGSVRIPAAFNGLVGLRPSMGLISQQGMFPMGNLDGTAGPLTRSTKDLAIALDVIADPAKKEKSYVSFLNVNGFKAKRIGIVHLVHDINTFNQMPPFITALIEKAKHDMQTLGATFIDIDLPQFDNNRDFNQSGEIEDVNAYLNAFPGTRRNFQDICESQRTTVFGRTKGCLNFMNRVAKHDSRDYQLALFIFTKNKQYIESIMEKNHLDALLIPISTHGSATYDALTVNTWRAPVSSNTGLPSIAFNIGYVNQMPVGIELIGPSFKEGDLIAMAYAYEIHHAPRIKPVMPKANDELTKLSIPKMNHLLTLIGVSTYQKVIVNLDENQELSEILTPTLFAKIVEEELKANNINPN